MSVLHREFDIIGGRGSRGANGGDGSEGGRKPGDIVVREAESQNRGKGEAQLRGEGGKYNTETG